MAATAMTTATIHVRTEILGAEPVENTIGTISIPISDQGIDLPDLRRALGELLCEAGAYLREAPAPAHGGC